MTFGWSIDAAVIDSCLKRSRKLSRARSSGAISLKATRGLSARCVATYTTPMPPRPASASIRWPAKTWPISTWSAIGRRPPRLLARGQDRDHAPAPALFELHGARPRGVDRVVLADAGALAGLEARPALAHDDLTAVHDLTGEPLPPESLGVRVATVPARAESLLMSHPRPPCPSWRRASSRPAFRGAGWFCC